MLATDHETGLTQERLKALLRYDPETGLFAWLVRRPNGVKVGDEAGNVSVQGYRVIGVDGRTYTAGRLAWLYMTGEWPVCLVDHTDTNKTNNAWANLRAASHAENIRNRTVQKNTRSGLKGAHYVRTRTSNKKWAAHIRVGGVLRTLGYFAHPEEAHAAYTKAAEMAFGQFARS